MIQIQKLTQHRGPCAEQPMCHNCIMISAPLSYILQAFHRLEFWGNTWHKNCSNESREKKKFPMFIEAIKDFRKRVGVLYCTSHLRESRSLSISRSLPATTWVIIVQACRPDCCVTVWGRSSSARDEKWSCSGRIRCWFFWADVMCCLCEVLSNAEICLTNPTQD